MAAAAAIMLAACEHTASSVTGKADDRPATVAPAPVLRGSTSAETVRETAAGAPGTPSPQTEISRETREAAGAPAMPSARAVRRNRVALLLPLSGPRAALGQALLDAALLAQFDVAGDDFVLMPFDTATGGQAAATHAIEAGAGLVVGPVFSDAVSQAARVTVQAGLDMLAFSNDSTVARPGVFLSGLLPEAQISRIVGYAVGKGFRRFAALLPAGPFGVRARAAFETALASLGATRAEIRYFGGEAGSAAAAVRAVARYFGRNRTGANGVNALLLAASGSELTDIAAQLAAFDIGGDRVQLLGLASWAAPGIGREPALAGAWFASMPEVRAAEFRRAFSDVYNTPPHALGTVVYDMVALAAVLASSGNGPTRAALTSESGFSGVGGVFRFFPNGLSKRVLEVREILPSGTKLLEKSPESLLN